MRRSVTVLSAAVVLLALGVVAGFAAAGGSGTVTPPPRIAFLANGQVPADALAAGPIAGRLGAPLYTTPSSALAEPAADGVVAYAPELVIVLGGAGAIEDTVLAELAAATGLPLLAPEQVGAGTDGIVRVAGADRYATAQAVADLVSTFSPAFLPVDATALGAVEADLLDGLDATDFARSDRACGDGEVVVGIDAAGEPTCAVDAVDGGDAQTVDGIDGADLVTTGLTEVVSTAWTPVSAATADQVSNWTAFGPYLNTSGDGAGPWGFTNYPTLPAVLSGQQLELVGAEVCQNYYSGTIQTASVQLRVLNDESTVVSASVNNPLGFTDGCVQLDLPTPTALDGIRRAVLDVSASGEGEIRYHGVRYLLQPVTD